MADCKIKNYSNMENVKLENIPVQVTTIHLTKNNYLRWSAAITMTLLVMINLSILQEENLLLLKPIHPGRLGSLHTDLNVNIGITYIAYALLSCM